MQVVKRQDRAKRRVEIKVKASRQEKGKDKGREW
jgi:hypothetical protein